MIQVVYPEAVCDELICMPITLTKTDITGVKTLPGVLIEVMNSEGTDTDVINAIWTCVEILSCCASACSRQARSARLCFRHIDDGTA